ncbi:MAG: I78 family peptidase inhibitor [Pseudomonadota bacterium]
MTRVLMCAGLAAVLAACSAAPDADAPAEEPAEAKVTVPSGEVEVLSDTAVVPEGDLAGPTGDISCGAEDFQTFVGQDLEALTIPDDMNVRVLRPGTAVSMEYIADRMNIHIGLDGKVSRVTCG